MTANLINYWSYHEGRRHNEATEAETVRHNLATEAYNRDALAETIRHNLASESEISRHNVVTEREAHRANLAYELELQRHNTAVEFESNRHNLAVERETERANKASESIRRESNQISWANVSLGYAQLAEQSRHNQATEANQLKQIQEAARHNRVNERQDRINSLRNYSINRDNLGLRTTESNRDFLIDLAKVGISRDTLAENSRHNLVTERNQTTSTISRTLVDISSTARNIAGIFN